VATPHDDVQVTVSPSTARHVDRDEALDRLADLLLDLAEREASA